MSGVPVRTAAALRERPLVVLSKDALRGLKSWEGTAETKG